MAAQPKERKRWVPRTAAVCLLLALLLGAVYANSFDASWHFDDKPNIVDNSALHLRDLQLQSLRRALFSDPRNPWESRAFPLRPLAMLSFALNWYWGQDNVAGYHAVNLAAHILAALGLYAVMAALARSPNSPAIYRARAHGIALLAAALWAVNPIQTQAVTYIVQRATLLGALFFLTGMYAFIRARLAPDRPAAWGWWAACAAAYLLALGCKRNTALLPLALLLVEAAFFRDLRRSATRRRLGLAAAGIGAVIAIAAVWLVWGGELWGFASGYASRPFSAVERLLTEPRVLLRYLTLIFYPIPQRLSIEHDVVVSTSLWQPATTLPALAAGVGIVGICLAGLARKPVLCFSALFFFLNHGVESTILPLELMFEHRNYLPSAFLFWPIAGGLVWLLDERRRLVPVLRAAVAGFVALLLIGLGIGTHMRNRVWATEQTLWLDAMHKAPESARPPASLAWLLAYGPDAHPRHDGRALSLYRQALAKQHSKRGLKAAVLVNMAGIHSRRGDHARSEALLRQALSRRPGYTKARFDLAVALIGQGRWSEALVQTRMLTATREAHEGYLNLEGAVLLHLGDAEGARHCFHKALRRAPHFKRTSLLLGQALSRLQYYQRADWFLHRAARLQPRSMDTLLTLIDNNLRAGKPAAARHYAAVLASEYAWKDITRRVARVRQGDLFLQIDAARVAGVLADLVRQRAEDLAASG